MDELLAKVPEKLHARFREIVALTDAFCAAHLNDEYRDICRRMAVAVCKAKLTVTSGKAAGWGIGDSVAAVGYVNFLSDPSQQFHTSPADMVKATGVSAATMQSKSKLIRDALRAERFDPRFSSRALIDDNPMTWMLSVNGLLMDIRQAPRGAQEEALRRGLIPYIPGDPPTSPAPARAGKGKATKPAGPARVYAFDVQIVSGPVTAAFAKKNKAMVRTIEIRGDQTLEDLHDAIFAAFDRDDAHMYEFQFGKRPMERDAPRYVTPFAMEDDDGEDVAGRVDETTEYDDLKLKAGAVFWYWFDFGDDWHHQVKLAAISDGVGKGRYPRVTKRIGESPPQYMDWDEE